MRKDSPLWPIWLAVLWIAVPLVWSSIFTGEYFFSDARGLQKAEISGPILFAIVCWAILLTVPKFRTKKNICAAGGFLLAVGFFLSYYSGFEHTGCLTFWVLGLGLLRLPDPMNAKPNSTFDTDAQVRRSIQRYRSKKDI